jgi:hypothetical protein
VRAGESDCAADQVAAVLGIATVTTANTIARATSSSILLREIPEQTGGK